MNFIVILSFVVMYFVLWCFLRVASLADKEYEENNNNFIKKRKKDKR